MFSFNLIKVSFSLKGIFKGMFREKSTVIYAKVKSDSGGHWDLHADPRGKGGFYSPYKMTRDATGNLEVTNKIGTRTYPERRVLDWQTRQ